MAGKKDIVEQALKLIAGGAKEAGPSVAERAAKNIDVFNTANRLGVDTNDIAKLQETKRLMDYHKGFMGDVQERAKSLNKMVQQMKASGAFPMEIGTRYTTEHSRRTGQAPWTVTNYYVDPKNPQGSYGYYVRRELPEGGYEESISKIRDPNLEALHGPEKWEELQRGFVPMTGPKAVKASGGSIREGYQTKGRVVGDIVDQALKLVMGAGEKTAPSVLVERGKNTPISAWHATEKPFTSYDWGLLGSTTKPNVEGTGVENWAMDLARVGPWSSEKKIDLGFGTHIPVTVGGKGKAFNSLDDLQRAIAKAGGPDKFRQNMTVKGFGHLRVADEEFGGTSYVSLTPENFTVRDDPIDRASGGSIRQGYGPGGWVDDVVKMAGKVISGEGEDAAKAGIRAYHASPHDFDKFEWSPRTSMTGEGAQSYGAGLYFAESPSVSGRGGTYDKQFTRKLQEIDRTGELGEKMGRVKIGGKPSTEYGIENDPGFIEAVKAGNVEKYARERLDRWHELSADEKYPYRDYATEKMRAWEKLLNDYSGGADVYYPMKARIYEANIAADPEKMMRWDEPLKDQPVEVMRGLGVLNAEDIAALQAEKRAIESKLQSGGWNDPIETQNPDEFWSKVNASVAKNSDDYSRLMKIERELSRAGKNIPDVTSGKFYKSSSERPENISLELRDRGVPGIQFWDGNSRGKSYLSQWRTDPLGGWTTDAFPSKSEATEYLNDVLRSAPALKGDERFSRVIQNPKATSNYVITNDKLISIVRKYGIAGASAMLGYNLMEQLDPKQALAASMADQDYQASRPQRSMGGNNSISGALNVARGLNGGE